MSFVISLKKNNSPSSFVNKELQNIGDFDGVLREEANIIDPIVVLQNETAAQIISSANYAYIAEFGRYYYIVNITSVSTGLWELELHVDVLMSYKSQILAQTAVVARQENRRNMYLDDGWFMAYQNPIIQTKYFSATAPFETQEFVLLLAGS